VAESGNTGGRIDFTGLTEFLSQFDEARDHFLLSQRELLLSFRSVVDIMARVSEKKGGDPSEDNRLNVLLVLRSVMDYIIARTPHPHIDQAVRSKVEALESIVQVLDSERRRLSAVKDDEMVQAKLEAIDAVKRLLLKEIDQAREDLHKPEPRVRKVPIE